MSAFMFILSDKQIKSADTKELQEMLEFQEETVSSFKGPYRQCSYL